MRGCLGIFFVILTGRFFPMDGKPSIKHFSIWFAGLRTKGIVSASQAAGIISPSCPSSRMWKMISSSPPRTAVGFCTKGRI